MILVKAGIENRENSRKKRKASELQERRRARERGANEFFGYRYETSAYTYRCGWWIGNDIEKREKS